MYYEWPNQVMPALPTICSVSPDAIGIAVAPISLTTIGGSNATANRAYLIPFHLAEPILVTKLGLANGAVPAGNIDLGIYDSNFTRIVSSGSTAQAGVSVAQWIDITDTIIGPGDFYLALACSTISPFVSITLATPTANRSGMLQMASAFPLPATITPATIASGVLPMIGLRQGGTAV